MSVKMMKQHIFIIENNLQKVGQSFFHLSRRTTVIQDLLVRRQFSLVPPIGQTLMSRLAIGYTSLFYLSMLSMFFIPPLPEGGGGYTVLPLSIRPRYF